MMNIRNYVTARANVESVSTLIDNCFKECTTDLSTYNLQPDEKECYVNCAKRSNDLNLTSDEVEKARFE